MAYDAIEQALETLGFKIEKIAFVPVSNSRNCKLWEEAKTAHDYHMACQINWKVTVSFKGHRFKEFEYSQGPAYIPNFNKMQFKNNCSQLNLLRRCVERNLTPRVDNTGWITALSNKPFVHPSIVDLIYSLKSDSCIAVEYDDFDSFYEEFCDEQGPTKALDMYNQLRDLYFNWSQVIDWETNDLLDLVFEDY